jgi:Contractile injection system tube protein
MATNVVNTTLGLGGGIGNDALSDAGDFLNDATSFLEYVPATLIAMPFVVGTPIPLPIPIPIQFKPEKWEVSKGAYWRQLYTGELDVPEVEFAGGEPEKLRLKLFFDTTSTGLDVRMYTKPIQMLVYRIPFTDSPPLVMVIWGTLMSKPSYITDLDIEYNMFLPQGIPVRAEMSLSLTEYNLGWLSMLPMNPTSTSEARKTWVVVEGQTLDWIAHREYGKSSAWRHIAKTNDLDDPMNLTPGQILKLTPLP